MPNAGLTVSLSKSLTNLRKKAGGVKRLNTYGTLDIGEVPKAAFVITAILNELMKIEHKNRK